MGLGDTAAAVGKGLAAGAAGTVAMTSTLEAKLRERGSSSAPADAT